jgi:deoxyribodipyrimidine photo-lyase
MKTSIIWFRRDLRLQDNPALDWVCENSKAVLPVYIHTDEEHWPMGGASRWWLHNSLLQLDRQLQSAGLKLHVFRGDSQQVIESLIEQAGASELVFNKLYEPDAYRRDSALTENLHHLVDVHAFDSGLFTVPGEVLNNQQLPYRVFTPFYKKIRPMLAHLLDIDQDSPLKSLKALKPVLLDGDYDISALQLLDENRWHDRLSQYWQPGEQNTAGMIDAFIDNAIGDYQVARDIPSLAGTSMLSAHLHFGEITPQRIVSSIWPILQGQQSSAAMNSAEVFVKQLLWREFAHHVLWHYPHTADRPMNDRYKNSFWRFDEKEFSRWTRGETGVPIVDAGMKQLWETGWMHNRVRMIVSSFLTKNLGIHWIYGARWFWDTLVDADLANNSMGWQWVAGCGVDAAPYYRVFNPLRQAQRFDEKQKYIDRWAPEHIELDYPQPMVDIASSRDQALSRYKLNISS